jgi:methyl-accepting chemotaxis protein
MAEVNHQVAERAQALTMSAQEARDTAASGRESVRQTLQGMTRIQVYVRDTALKVQALGENSREIDTIVGAISTIAQQTNRLALDAAVQAATAGEHGKGFGAVAADIRRLAERAKEQASSIARIVRGVSEEIDAAAISMKDTERETAVGAQQAEETGAALESIFGVVERQGSEIELIDQLANHQLQSSNAVVQIMQGVSAATRHSSANTRGAASSMEHLALLAKQLLSSVEAFKLPGVLAQPAPLAGRAYGAAPPLAVRSESRERPEPGRLPASGGSGKPAGSSAPSSPDRQGGDLVPAPATDPGRQSRLRQTRLRRDSDPPASLR